MANEVIVPAGFWIRILPSAIDSLILGVSIHLATGFRYLKSEDMGIAMKLSAANVVIAGIYAGVFYMKTGSTLGKKVFSLAVVDNQTGEKISFLRGFFRDTIGKLVSTVPCFIGFMMAGFNKDKRTLHDFIFDTRVVKRMPIVGFSQPAPVTVPVSTDSKEEM